MTRRDTKTLKRLVDSWPGRRNPPPDVSERNWEIAVSYVEYGRTMQSLADEHGVSAERVQAILETTERSNLKQRYALKALRSQAQADQEEAKKSAFRVSKEAQARLIAGGHIHFGWLNPRPYWRVDLNQSAEIPPAPTDSPGTP
jgi:hypothetical protein